MTLNGLTDVPPVNSRITSTNPLVSDAVNLLLVNHTEMSTIFNTSTNMTSILVISLTSCINNNYSCTSN